MGSAFTWSLTDFHQGTILNLCFFFYEVGIRIKEMMECTVLSQVLGTVSEASSVGLSLCDYIG